MYICIPPAINQQEHRSTTAAPANHQQQTSRPAANHLVKQKHAEQHAHRRSQSQDAHDWESA